MQFPSLRLNTQQINRRDQCPAHLPEDEMRGKSIHICCLSGEVEVILHQSILEILVCDERGNRICFITTYQEARVWAEAIWNSPPDERRVQLTNGSLKVRIERLPQALCLCAVDTLSGPEVEVRLNTLQAATLSLNLLHPVA